MLIRLVELVLEFELLLLNDNNLLNSTPSIKSLLFPFKLKLVLLNGAIFCSRLNLYNCDSYEISFKN